uniref:Ig-like domain-containing protein n=1 Tax=Pavo cristatus TaxID=9049 RepID=A0A8C9F6X8_PAVCR
VLGGSVLLSPVLPPGSRVKEIEWSFSSGAGATIQVAEFGPGGFERPDPQDRFKQLDPNLSHPMLGLPSPPSWGPFSHHPKQLQAGCALHRDAGQCDVSEQSCAMLTHSLLGAESVPRPRTHSQLLASTLEWCNLTLQCQGTGKGAVNVTWRRDNGRQELGTDRSQLSPDGTTLRLALQPGTANATYTCTVSNPGSMAIPWLSPFLCPPGGQVSFSKSGYIVLTLILLAVSLGGAFWCWRLNSEKSADPGQ